MPFLLDTNILSDAIRNPRGSAARRMQSRQTEVCTSIVAAAELRFGAEKKGARILSEKVEELLGHVPVLPLDTPADRAYAQLRTALERDGAPIGANDLLIAAHALALGCTLVTDNEREFSRVPNLKVENWLR